MGDGTSWVIVTWPLEVKKKKGGVMGFRSVFLNSVEGQWSILCGNRAHSLALIEDP